ncbi:MAG: radical SAM protein [Pseudomonadota bacterium]
MSTELVHFCKRVPANSASPVSGPRLRPRDELMERRIPLASKLSIILTDRCNIRCRHCMPECTPEKSTTLGWADLKTLIESAARVPTMKTLCFTGGEAFMYPELLADCIALTHRLGLESTVISNAFWASSVSNAERMLRRLPGLARLALSTDSFHQEFIGVGKVRHAIVAARRLSIDCAVRICHLDDPDAEIEAVRQQLADVAGLYEIEHQPVQPLGRAELEVEYDRIFSYDTSMASCRSADVHALNPNGSVTACCGGTGDWPANHLLDFGKPAEVGLDEIFKRAQASFALHAVRLWGPAGLFRLARAQAQHEGTDLPDPGIRNICELCKFLVADPARSALLRRALDAPEARSEIALARARDFGEIESLLLLHEGEGA